MGVKEGVANHVSSVSCKSPLNLVLTVVLDGIDKSHLSQYKVDQKNVTHGNVWGVQGGLLLPSKIRSSRACLCADGK